MRYCRPMNAIRKAFVALVALVGQAAFAQTIPAACNGSFVNPVTDICWECIFPMTLAGVGIGSTGQEDNSSSVGDAAICVCGTTAKVGMQLSFWEPVRRADITRVPYCMVGLGGVSLNMGVSAPQPVVKSANDRTKENPSVFYHAHWYIDPIIYWIGALYGSDCLERRGFDIAYVTELDPFWADDVDTIIFNVEAVLFANPLGQGV